MPSTELRQGNCEGSVVLVPEGVWDRQEVLSFFTNPENSAGDSFLIRSPRSSNLTKIPVTTIDKIRDDLKLNRVDFIKIDVEVLPRGPLRVPPRRLGNSNLDWLSRPKRKPIDPLRISRLVTTAQPRYQMECGHCGIQGEMIDPWVLFFY
jgi:hypothetical protein